MKRAIKQSTCAKCWAEFRGVGFLCEDCKFSTTGGTCRERAKLGDALTAREAQVVELVRQGKSNKLVAAALNLTEGTVKVYLSTVFIKTGCGSRLELAVRVQETLMQAQINALQAQVKVFEDMLSKSKSKEGENESE